ncbi:helix-turn-helix domain-containing protein [Streptomyces sp. M10(2022)]
MPVLAGSPAVATLSTPLRDDLVDLRLGPARQPGCPRPTAHITPTIKDLSMPARLLSIPAVAAALDVDRRTIYRFIAVGDLPVVDLRTRPGRSRVRVPAASVDEFIIRRAVVMPAARC